MTKKQKKHELVFGIHPIVELLKAKRRALIALYTTKPVPKSWSMIQELLPKGVPIHYVSRDALTRMALSDDHQGVIGWASEYPYRAKPFDKERHGVLVMLDGIQDPRNLGAIIRSAYCTGVTGVIITKKSSSPLTAAAIKASAGLAEHIEIYQAASAASALQDLKKSGYHIYLAMLGGHDATDFVYEKPCCVVIGNEAQGLSSVLRVYGMAVMLPQRRPDISYNASVAAGILLFLIAFKK